MKKIILDTNFFIDLVKFKIGLSDFDSIVSKPYQILTLKSVVDELKNIKNKNARAALKLVEIKRIKVIEHAIKNTDKAFLSIASKDRDVIIATNDAKLRKNLKALGTKTIYLRKRKQLAIG